MATVLLAIGILGAAVALLAVRILFVRGGEFRGACASNNPFLLKAGGACWGCGRSAEETQDCEYGEAASQSVESGKPGERYSMKAPSDPPRMK